MRRLIQRERPVFLALALALLAGLLAYQVAPSSALLIGWPGDRLFLRASEGQGAADTRSFYGDELTPHARSGRSRWSRQEAAITLPGLGGADLMLILRAQGWPSDALAGPERQPLVLVEVDGTLVGRFTPSASWADYQFFVPAHARASPDLALTLRASETFTGTAAFADPRPKGIRLDYLEVRGVQAGPALPAPLPLALLLLDSALAMLALRGFVRRPGLVVALTALLIGAIAPGLALARAWTAALLPWSALVLALALLVARRNALAAILTRLFRRARQTGALDAALAVTLTIWLVYLAARAALVALRLGFPAGVPYGLLGLGALALLWGPPGLSGLARAIARAIGSRRVAPALLLLFAAGWIGYEASVIAALPYVGHADYADNAVVARNLVQGRGWVVDYVTQFYRLYDGVTRPQETWPLLQPVWIAPFFALFGATAWAAKIPNLFFSAALAALLYVAGARWWDRRAGLTAAIVVLTSHLFFKLVIYVTSDLAFVVFSFAAIALLERATAAALTTSRTSVRNPNRKERKERKVLWNTARFRSIAIPLVIRDRRSRTRKEPQRIDLLTSMGTSLQPLIGSAVFTGLMLLQKPGSGALIGLGMGVWLLAQGWRGARKDRRRTLRAPLLAMRQLFGMAAVWGAIALLILSPYLIRNLTLFGAPFYSTESRDAWVLEYTDWDEIYKVYTTEQGLGRDGPPDRSWLLRWGFDRVALKLSNQVAAVRDYLLPPWKDLPLDLSDVLSGRKALLFGVGAWFGLLGAIWLRPPRLGGLLLAAFGPYILFLVVYWHANEERYFVVLMPWLALFAAAALWRIHDRLAALRRGRMAPAALALALCALALTILPSRPEIARKVSSEPQLYAADLDAYAWLRDHTSPGEVVMTRLPWQLNWHSQRPALMIPHTTDRDVFLRIARYYHARYLVLDSLQRPRPEVRRMLDALLRDPRAGFERVYVTPDYQADVGPMRTEIYRFPRETGDGRREIGDGRPETGDRRRETGDGRQMVGNLKSKI